MKFSVIILNACQWPIIWIKIEEEVLHVLVYCGLLCPYECDVGGSQQYSLATVYTRSSFAHIWASNRDDRFTKTRRCFEILGLALTGNFFLIFIFISHSLIVRWGYFFMQSSVIRTCSYMNDLHPLAPLFSVVKTKHD